MTASSLQKKIRMTLSAVPLLLVASPALAALQDSTGLSATAGAAALPTGGDLPTIVGKFIAAALGLLGVIFVILVIYAGFLWMTAQGNDEKVKMAKKIITRAVFGLILIFSAYLITNAVVSALRTSLGPSSGYNPADPGY